ncbi:MAG TPA: hypothetical protein VIQ31_02125 [Phormidium sp.]
MVNCLTRLLFLWQLNLLGDRFLGKVEVRYAREQGKDESAIAFGKRWKCGSHESRKLECGLPPAGYANAF